MPIACILQVNQSVKVYNLNKIYQNLNLAALGFGI